MKSKFLILATCFTLALSFSLAAAQNSPSLKQRPSSSSSVIANPNALPTGTGLHVVLDQEISSATAKINDPFIAHLTEAVVVNGATVLPAGTVVKGRVKDVTNAGRRFHGKNNLTLRPETITLTDGRQIDIAGIMIDTYDRKALKLDDEGTVTNGAGHYGRMAVIGTGVGTVAGAVVGGPVGAVAGGSIGAALPTARWATKDDPVVLENGTTYWFELTHPVLLSNNQAALNGTKDSAN
jgi:hypothetical protein